MSSLRTRSVVGLTGLYAGAALFIAAATSASTPSSPTSVYQRQSVDRVQKSDLLTRSKTSKEATSSISVELSGRSDVVIRDRAGNILFAVDNAARVKPSQNNPTTASSTHRPSDFGKREYGVRRAKAIEKHLPAIICEPRELRQLFDLWLGPSDELGTYLGGRRPEQILVANSTDSTLVR
jgi:hypothetical protein